MIPALASQRAMRERFRHAIRRGLIAAIDVGTSKTACFVLRVDAQRLARAQAEGRPHDAFAAVRIIGAGITRSRGVRLGEIVEMDKCARAVRTALDIAERAAGERVDQAFCALGGGRPASLPAHGAAMLEGMAVVERDIARVVTSSRGPWHGRSVEEGRETLHAQPVNFSVDGQDGLTDPRGMTGERIGVDLHVLTVASSPLRNLAHCVRRCDLELAGVVSGSYAAALSSLVEDEQKLGAACIDMGAGATGLAVFLRGHLIHADGVRIGGEHVTRDIASGLSMPEAAAERIKTVHGGAVATGLDDRELFEAPRFGAEGAEEPRRISRAALIGVIRPRLEETLETARDRLRSAGFQNLPGRRIVLTGGASQMPGLEEMAQRILGRHVRVGRPMRVAGLPQTAIGPAFAASVGLAIYAARPQDEVWDFDVPVAPSTRGRLRRTVRWFKDNW